jgi:beta-phosphoglucomutase-like phosphatase (HAD superfamily)
MAAARPALEAIGVDPAHVSVITRDQVQHAKPDPDLFIAASSRLGVDSAHAVVVGDSVWAFWRRAAPAHSAWVFSRAATAGKSSSALERTASTTTRPICCVMPSSSRFRNGTERGLLRLRTMGRRIR